MKNPTIVVAAYNRKGALERLLTSLSRAAYPRRGIHLVISIDGGGPDNVLHLAESFEWAYGEKHVIRHTSNLGLRENILSCGDLSQHYGSVIVLEDDLLVSPDFYSYALQASDYYQDDSSISQISLYAYQYSEFYEVPFRPIADGLDVYFMQWASSWGQLWTQDQWRRFRFWYDANTDFDFGSIDLSAFVRGWPSHSWKKYFIAYLIETDTYAVYPRASYVTNTGEVGTNHASQRLSVQSPLPYQAPATFRFGRVNQSFAIYDAYFQLTKTALDRMCPFLKDYDYQVDLLCSRNLERLKCEYLITTRQSRKPILQYDWNVAPMEMNMVLQNHGSRIVLSHVNDLEQHISFGERMNLSFTSMRVLSPSRGFVYYAIKLIRKLLRL